MWCSQAIRVMPYGGLKMASAVQPFNAGNLDVLEKGIRTLKKSKLFLAPEFKNMLHAMERHHNDVRLAHLSGKSNDLIEQACHDTKFYNILVKMLYEVTEKRMEEQKHGLQKVHTWYLANKHTLSSGRYFGKKLEKQKAREMASNPRITKGCSARQNHTSGTPAVPQLSEQGCAPLEENDLVKQDESQSSHSHLEWDFSVSGDEYEETDFKQNTIITDHCELQCGVHSPFLVLHSVDSEAETKNRSLSSEASSTTSRKTVHPISSMVNPHAILAAQIAQDKQEKQQAQHKGRKKLSRKDNLQAWQDFSKNQSIEQLTFKRQGDVPGLKHFSNDLIEMPELYTKDIIAAYANASMQDEEEIYNPEQKENILVQQSLEEFYQTADTLYPHLSKKTSLKSRAQVRSAPAVGQSMTHSQRMVQSARVEPQSPRRNFSPHPNTLGHQLHLQIREEKRQKENREETLPLKLNAVVNNIASVLANMTSKDKLVLETQRCIRQPAVSGLVATSSCLSSPSLTQSNTSQCEYVSAQPPRSYSTSVVSQTMRPREDEGSHSPLVRQVQDRCKSAGVIDWRGRVKPDTVRYRWRPTKFGAFTHVKSHQKPVSGRSAGSTSAGHRPRTASIPIKDKWKTEKLSDKNPRVSAQAASNCMTQISQQEMENLLSVRYLLGTANSRSDSLTSLYDLDEELLRNFHRRPVTQADAPREFLSFISPSPGPTSGCHSQAKTLESGDVDDRPKSQELMEENVQCLLPDFKDMNLPLSLEASLPEGPSAAANTNNSQHSRQLQQEEEAGRAREPEKKIEKEDLAQLELKEMNTEREKRAVAECQQVQQFSTSKHLEQEVKQNTDGCARSNATTWAGFRPQSYRKALSADISSLTSTERTLSLKFRRSAGRMPSQASNTFTQMQQVSQHHKELLCRTPPPRTAPSIPQQKTALLGREYSAPGGPMLMELEQQARRMKSPRSFVQNVKNLRSICVGVRNVSSAPTTRTKSLESALQVYGFNISLPKQQSLPILFDDHSHNGGSLHFTPSQPSDASFCPENPHQNVNGNNIADVGESVPCMQTPSTQTAVKSNPDLSHQTPGHLDQRATSDSVRNSSSKHSSSNGSIHNMQNSLQNKSKFSKPREKNLAHIGRPIAQVAQIYDPEELTTAVNQQKEAAAAVDIQRIFRGYIARNVYKMLRSDERKQLEDKQRAAVEIQRAYRSHLCRKRAIETRSPDRAMAEWTESYEKDLAAKRQQRDRKMGDRAEELYENYHSIQSQLSVIGPHVDIYQIYHPKKLGPSRKELNVAATVIQRYVRGWLVRRRFDKLNRKAAWYGSAFSKMVKEYKSMLVRVQRQHGVAHPCAPFTTRDMNDYIDTRRRFESVFEKKAFGGELELEEIDSFFKECDLYPSQAEIDEALDVTIKGKPLAHHGWGLKRHEILDVVFYIYTPRAAGLENVRHSTWMNPIIDGVEAKRLLGSEFVEDAPLAVCAQLVINSQRERREKEQAALKEQKNEEADNFIFL